MTLHGGIVMLGKLLQAVLDLQPVWSHLNTPDMDRRGIIVRREIPSLIKERLNSITAGSIVSDLDWAVEGRDGQALKLRFRGCVCTTEL